MTMMNTDVVNEKCFRTICHMAYVSTLQPLTPISDPTRSHWPILTNDSWSTRRGLSNELLQCTLCLRWKFSTLTFDLGGWPWGLKINRVLALDHSDPHTKFERNRSTRSWVIMLTDRQTDRQTDKHDKVNTCWRFAFSGVIKLLCNMLYVRIFG
jgi:hypothetical protein